MFRGTGADVISFPGRGNDEVLLLPYFGRTELDNWYLTYPAFQIAASKQGMDDPEREKLILDIMTAMVDQDGQDHISYGKNMVPYKKDVTLELMPQMDNLKPYVKQNKLYIRLASNEMFRISKDVVQMILSGGITTPQEALAAFNEELAGEEPGTEIVARIDTGYSNDFTPPARQSGGVRRCQYHSGALRRGPGIHAVLLCRKRHLHRRLFPQGYRLSCQE